MADKVTQANRFTVPTEFATTASYPSTGPVLWPPEHRSYNLVGEWQNATAAHVGDLVSISESSGTFNFDYVGAAWKGRIGIVFPRTDVPGHTVETTYDQYDLLWVRELVPGDEIVTWEDTHANAAVAAGDAYKTAATGCVAAATVGTDHVRFISLETKTSADTTDTPRSHCVKFIA